MNRPKQQVIEFDTPMELMLQTKDKDGKAYCITIKINTCRHELGQDESGVDYGDGPGGGGGGIITFPPKPIGP